jgi:hypothetical protein
VLATDYQPSSRHTDYPAEIGQHGLAEIQGHAGQRGLTLQRGFHRMRQRPNL